jgi:signal transduction histidine kinase
MTVRARVVWAFVVFAAPAMLLVAWLSWQWRRDAAVDALVAAATERMESGGRERCEADPSSFGEGWRGRHRHPRGGRRPTLRGARLRAYDAELRPGAPGVPPLERALRESLEAGDDVAVGERAGGSPVIAMRMPWTEGPCAVLTIEPRDGPLASHAGPLVRDLALGFGALAVGLVVALIALGPPLRRLGRLAESVKKSGDGLAVPPGVAGEDEIGAVARALEESGARIRAHVAGLEKRERALSEYVDGTTHDLAIPLTVLQGRLSDAERALREGAPVDPALVAGAIAECEYVAQLVANLAAAARLEGGAERVARGEVDLACLVERVASRHRPIARHHGVELDFATPERAVRVRGDDILLERALRNLVHNAIRHSGDREGGHVAMLLESKEGRFALTILDDNPQVDEALAARLARGDAIADPRRARGRGLGLGIVRRVAEAHGMALSFRAREGGGLEVRLEGELLA